MEWVILGFGGLALVVGIIIAAGAWIAFRRDRHLPNTGVKMKRPKVGMPLSDPRRGVPKTR